MISVIKGRLLNYLFNDWLNRVEDREILGLTKVLITKRESELEGIENPTGRTIIKGFRQ